MKIRLLLCTVFIFFAAKIIAQNADEEAIKNVVKTETETLFKKDSSAWESLYIQDAKFSRIYVSNSGYSKVTGWDSLLPYALQWFRNPEPSKFKEVENNNYTIRVNNDMASVEYYQHISWPGTDSLKPHSSHEIRTLMKVNNQWKIASSITIDTLSYTSGDSVYIEDNLNATGYRLLNAKKIKDAIEVFKVNVKLFPHSWNVYDSLGEAYADDNNSDAAIKNYEMSVKINPKNDNGKQVLEKLKKKK